MDQIRLVIPYVLAVFLGAFLVFWVQPLFAKMLLPSFGGAPTVWIAALMFFQGVLLTGYVYAHFLARIPGVLTQAGVHLALAALAFLVLPPTLGAVDPAVLAHQPLAKVLKHLALGVGLPMVVLSATAPLVQKWFSLSEHTGAADPYFLYAASNAGSLGALIAFPLVLEPLVTLSRQGLVWSGLFVVTILTVLFCGYLVRRQSAPTREASKSEVEGFSWRDRLWVVVLAAVPASLLSGVTLLITTDVAAVPLFWVVPLILYLLTFIAAFSGVQILPTKLLRVLIGLLLIPAPMFILFGQLGLGVSATGQIIIILVLLTLQFFISLACHQELWRHRPDTDDLTLYYVVLAFGGFLGGAFNAVIAPLVFKSVAEFSIALTLAVFLSAQREEMEPVSPEKLIQMGVAALFTGALILMFLYLPKQEISALGWLMAAVIAVSVFMLRPRIHAVFLGLILFFGGIALGGDNVFQERSFFGVLKVQDSKEKGVRTMFHGTTVHGRQFLDPEKGTEPLSYYGADSPISEIFQTFEDDLAGKTIGVTGLGAGVLACYAKPDQHWIFYELDPMVAEVASDPDYFTFLSECPPEKGIMIGDGRLNIEQGDETFALLILDAFTSDSVPVHLLTREAFESYLVHLEGDGIIAVNISNRYLNLAPLLASIADDFDLVATFGKGDPAPDTGQFPSHWVVLAKTSGALQRLTGGPRVTWQALSSDPEVKSWTDDYSNIIQFLKW